MTSDDIRFQDYLAGLRARVTERCLELAEDSTAVAPTLFRQNGFTATVLDTLVDLGQLSDSQPCYVDKRFGRHAGKLDAWSVDEDDGRVDLVTTIFNNLNGSDSVPPGHLAEAARRALRVFLAARESVHRDMEPASPAFDMMQRFHDVSNEIGRIRVIVLADGIAGEAAPFEADPEAPEVTIEVWDLRRLFRAESSGAAYEAIRIDLDTRMGSPLPCLPASGDDADHRCYLAILPGELLHSLYHEFGPRLLELNVRSFLQARGKVNREIRNTLKDEPARFLAYNNGISATVEAIEFIEDDGGQTCIRSMTGLQIVNGGQTMASVHRAKDRDRLDISSVQVQAKITLVRPDRAVELVSRISRSANTQNRINEADFSATHPFHTRIQQLSETVWSPGEQHRWFYERARGQYEVAKIRAGSTTASKRRFEETTPSKQRFDKVLLAKYVNAWDQLPHVVSRGGQKNFVEFMMRLAGTHGRDWLPEPGYYRHLIAEALIFKHAEWVARVHRFPAYRANAVAYTVALASYRTAGRIDLETIWNQQTCSSALAETLNEWMPHVWDEITKSAGGRNVTEWCKKEECWREIQTLTLQVPRALELELASGQPLPTVGAASQQQGIDLTSEDRENIARIMQVTAERWIHLVSWGSRTGHLEGWQIGIASTLATYAAMGWTKVPSKKQARQAMAILSLADAHDAWPRLD